MGQLTNAMRQAVALIGSPRLIRYRGGDPAELERKVEAFYRSESAQAYYQLQAGEDRYDGLARRDTFLDRCARAKNIVEFGCGAGGVSARIAKTFPDKTVHAIDLGEHAGQLIPDDVTNLRFRKASVLSSGIPSESMDLLISAFVIEHVVYPDKMLKEAHRVLRSGGTAYLLYPQLLLRVSPLTALIEMISWVMLTARPIYLDPQIVPETQNASDLDAVWLTNPVKMSRLLRSAGFRVVLNKPSQSLIVAEKRT
jgi:SAM-dependent methyltransferase